MAIMSYDSIFRSSDNGLTWEGSLLGHDRDLTSIQSIGGDSWLVSSRELYRSDDNGETWSIIQPDLSLQELEMVSTTRGFAILGWNTILITDDAGMHWDTVYHEESSTFIHNLMPDPGGESVSFLQRGEMGWYTWLRTYDLGSSTDDTIGLDVDLNYPMYNTVDSVLFHSLEFELLKSEDRGLSWSSALNLYENELVYDLLIDSTGSGILVGGVYVINGYNPGNYFPGLYRGLWSVMDAQ